MVPPALANTLPATINDAMDLVMVASRLARATARAATGVRGTA
jgi:hypothetical protein